MLDDLMVNFMKEGIIKVFDIDGAELKEKVVGDKKIKFKFERGSLKLQIEFGEDEIIGIVYDNFIDKDWYEYVTLNEFMAHFRDYLDNMNDTTTNQIRVAADRICHKIRQSKLPFVKE